MKFIFILFAICSVLFATMAMVSAQDREPAVPQGGNGADLDEQEDLRRIQAETGRAQDKFWTFLDAAQQKATDGSTRPPGKFPMLVTVARVINSILFFVGGIFIILILAGGVLWMTAGGNEEQVKKARDILTKSFIGFVIIMAGYLITFTVVRAYLWAAM